MKRRSLLSLVAAGVAVAVAALVIDLMARDVVQRFPLLSAVMTTILTVPAGALIAYYALEHSQHRRAEQHRRRIRAVHLGSALQALWHGQYVIDTAIDAGPSDLDSHYWQALVDRSNAAARGFDSLRDLEPGSDEGLLFNGCANALLTVPAMQGTLPHHRITASASMYDLVWTWLPKGLGTPHLPRRFRVPDTRVEGWASKPEGRLFIEVMESIGVRYDQHGKLLPAHVY